MVAFIEYPALELVCLINKASFVFDTISVKKVQYSDVAIFLAIMKVLAA